MLLDSDSWLNVLQEGLGFARSGEFDLALERFEKARQLAPTRAETACALGREHMRRGQSEQACALLQEAWEQDRTLMTAGTSLARCLGLDLALFSPAHQVLNEVDEARPGDEMSRLIRSEILLAEGRHEEAALIAEALVRADSPRLAKSASLLMSRVENERGLCAVRNAGYDRAIFAFRRASNLDALWAAPLSNLGAAFETLGKPRRAETAYRQAIGRDASYSRAWHNLAKLYRREGDRRAMPSIEHAFHCDLANPQVAAEYALAQHEAGAGEQAKATLALHAEELGDLSESWASLALPLAAGGAPHLAEHCLHKAKERCSDPTLLQRTQTLLESAPLRPLVPPGKS